MQDPGGRCFGGCLFIAFSLAAGSAQAQTRSETLRYVTGAAINTLDPTMPGSTREILRGESQTYDRLVSFGRKQLDDNWVFDLDKITGELAEATKSARIS